jgi:hypothetical protein
MQTAFLKRSTFKVIIERMGSTSEAIIAVLQEQILRRPGGRIANVNRSQSLISVIPPSRIVSTKRFIITENKEKADAILKGVGLKKTSQELHATGEATSVGAAAGGHSGSVNGSDLNGNGSVSVSSSGGFAARHMGIEDSQASVTAVNDARIAVRLVSVDGDVPWSTTKESKGP